MDVLTSTFLTSALYYAPVVYHQTGNHAKADQMTRVDFDGDFNSENNWENLDKYPTPAHVYYDVVETKTHFFISYAFFHPRDYSYLCVPKICHENDMEGALFVVKKDISPYGHLELIQTLAHNKIFSYSRPQYVEVDPNRDLMNRRERPALYIEWGGHGVYMHQPEARLPANPAEAGMPDSATRRARYFIYQVGERADDLRDTREGSFRYQLLNTKSELWDRRHQVGKDRLFLKNFNYVGMRNQLGPVPYNFGGSRFSKGLANPPWAWADTSRDDVKRGDWFFDPAFFVAQTLGTRVSRSRDEQKFSLQYVYHPYMTEHLSSANAQAELAE